MEGLIIASVLLRDQISDDFALIVGFTLMQVLGHGAVGFDGSYTIDARHRGDDDHIIPLQQSAGGRVAHTVNLFVDLTFFFNIGVGTRHIGLWLVIVVIAHEILNGIVGEKSLKLAIKLGCEGFVGGENNCGALGVLNDPGHSERFARACGAQKHLVLFTCLHTGHQFLNGCRLIACCGEFSLQLKRLASFHLLAIPHVWRRVLQKRHLFGRIVVHV